MSLVARYAFFIGAALLILALDQYTKVLAYDNLLGQPAVEILPVFSLVLVFNEGAAFGFLHDAGGWQHYLFVGLASVFSLVLIVWIWRECKRNGWLALALSLVLGGAIGNLLDRVNHGYVVDFILLHYSGWTFPAFNIADMAITIGAIMLIIDSLFLSRS